MKKEIRTAVRRIRSVIFMIGVLIAGSVKFGMKN